MVYAGFWHRSGSIFIDSLIVLPLFFGLLWLAHPSMTLSAAVSVLLALTAIFYQVYFHARWGQTLGKMAMGIKVVSLDGSSISWRQAVLRSSVDIILALAFNAAYISAVITLSTSGHLATDWLVRNQQLAEHMQPWHWLRSLQNVWIASEAIVMLLNSKRRALHDFIASTVVVRVIAEVEVEPLASNLSG